MTEPDEFARLEGCFSYEERIVLELGFVVILLFPIFIDTQETNQDSLSLNSVALRCPVVPWNSY